MAEINNTNIAQNLNNDAEDPVVVAQRFFNIFRQLHIFSPEKKENFNQMALELPAEVKAAFGNLPGGGLLKEYVLDLEKKSPNYIPQAVSPAAQQKNNVQNLLESVLNRTATNKNTDQQHSSVGTVSVDSNFTATIANVLKESQMEIAKMFIEHQKSKASFSDNPVPVSFSGEGIDLREFLAAQISTFQEMTKIQTTELSSIISAAIREGHELSTQNFIEALREFQQENAELMRAGQPRYIPDSSYTTTNDYVPKEKFFNKKKNKANKPSIFNNSFSEPVLSETIEMPIIENDITNEIDELLDFDDEPKINLEDLPEITTHSIPEELYDFSAELSDITEEPQIESPINQIPTAIAEEQDWEWEEEKTANTNAESEDDEDWEWAYEEDGNTEGVEGEDWEWEYEEVPDDEVVEDTNKK